MANPSELERAAAESAPAQSNYERAVEEYHATSKIICRECEAAKVEISRLKRGDFTPEEFQSLCHHRDEKPGCTRRDFGAGCQEYQRKLFGETACPACEQNASDVAGLQASCQQFAEEAIVLRQQLTDTERRLCDVTAELERLKEWHAYDGPPD